MKSRIKDLLSDCRSMLAYVASENGKDDAMVKLMAVKTLRDIDRAFSGAESARKRYMDRGVAAAAAATPKPATATKGGGK